MQHQFHLVRDTSCPQTRCFGTGRTDTGVNLRLTAEQGQHRTLTADCVFKVIYGIPSLSLLTGEQRGRSIGLWTFESEVCQKSYSANKTYRCEKDERLSLLHKAQKCIEIHSNSNVNLQHQQIMHCVYKIPKHKKPLHLCN